MYARLVLLFIVALHTSVLLTGCSSASLTTQEVRVSFLVVDLKNDVNVTHEWK